MKKLIFCTLLAVAASLSCNAQFYGIDVDKLSTLFQQTAKLPYDNAMIVTNSTMTALAQNPQGYRKALELAESHLGNAADSLHNEEMFIACLEHATTGYVLGNNEKDRYKLLLDMAKRNRIGTVAADIEYVTPDGKEHHLNEPGGQYTLLYFNDPDCDACQRVKDNMEQSTTLKGLVDQGLLRVVAIYPDNNQKLWKKSKFPAWMVNGWDKKQAIENNGTYVMPATLPVFYLLAPDKTVLMKNEPSLKRIESALGRVMTSSDNNPQSLAKMLFN